MVTDGNASESSAASSSEEPPEQQLDVLATSAGRLVALVEPMTPDEIRRPAYPSEWTIADVLSHLGSGAVIMRMNTDAILAGGALEMDAARAVWDEWNAKTPDEQASDAPGADHELLVRLGSVTAAERQGFRFPLGQREIDFAGYLGTRVNEHAVHSWDIAVVEDPTAPLLADAVGLIFDSLQMIVGFVGKPTGTDRAIRVATTAPRRHVDITLRPESVSFVPGAPARKPDLVLPAEAVIRLVYGRLDPDHTPPFEGAGADLDELRRAFPGV